MEHQSPGAIKALARGQLLTNYRTACPACLFILGINFLLTLTGALFIDQRSVSGIFLFEFFMLLKNILMAFLGVGESLLFLKLALGRKLSFRDIFWGFGNPGQGNGTAPAPYSGLPNKIILDALFLTLGESLFLLPAAFVAFSAIGRFLFYPLYLLGLAGSFTFRLIYSQVYYLLLDFPSRNWKELLTMSRLKMKGSKLRLFVLYLSFLPMMLLVVLSFGIGAILVVPYLQSARANFFLDLMQRS